MMPYIVLSRRVVPSSAGVPMCRLCQTSTVHPGGHAMMRVDIIGLIYYFGVEVSCCNLCSCW